jgi:3',5'-cyclic-AMP phosphodiesterase
MNQAMIPKHDGRAPFIVGRFMLRILRRGFQLRSLAAGFVLLFSVAMLAPTGWAATNAPIRVALLSDPHVSQGTNSALYAAHLDKAITAVNTSRVDLVLIAGDLTDQGLPEEIKAFQDQIKTFQAPVWYVPGNHDVGDKRLKGIATEINTKRLTEYERVLGKSWFVREHAGVRVVGINSSLLGSGLPPENDMWRWLEETLAAPSAIPTLVLMHCPPFSKSTDEPGGVYWNVEPEPRQRLLGLIRQAGVKAVLSGHLHQLLLNDQDHILFLTTLPISFSLPTGIPAEGWILLTITNAGVQWEIRTIPR